MDSTADYEDDEPLEPASVGTVEPFSESSSARQSAIRSEIEAVLHTDESALGAVYCGLQSGLSLEDIALARGEGLESIKSYSRTLSALLDGTWPTTPTGAGRFAQRVRRFLRENEFSETTRADLESRLGILKSRASDQNAKAAEDKRAIEATVLAEEHAVPGIYVYSLPHYLRHPYDESSERTLLKVGQTDRSSIKRFIEQTRTTALPEDPILLRVYPCGDDKPMELETSFHRLLEAADHNRSKARMGGKEWFLTSLKFLDEIAAVLHLQVKVVADLSESVD